MTTITAEKKRLQEEVSTLSDEMTRKVLNYVERLKKKDATRRVPEELIVRDKRNLEKKLDVAFADVAAGRTRRWEDVRKDLSRRYSRS